MDAPTPADATSTIKVEPTLLRPAHAHHWVIEPPNGPFSLGRCRSCNEERRFPNSSESAEWASDAPAEPVPDGEVASLERSIARERRDFRLSDEAA